MIALVSNRRVPAINDVRKPAFAVSGQEAALRGDVLHEHLVQRNYGPCQWNRDVRVNGKRRGFCFTNGDNPGKVEASCM